MHRGQKDWTPCLRFYIRMLFSVESIFIYGVQDQTFTGNQKEKTENSVQLCMGPIINNLRDSQDLLQNYIALGHLLPRCLVLVIITVEPWLKTTLV